MIEIPSHPSLEGDFLVIDTPNREDLILGFDFINQFNPSIDWRQVMISFHVNHKDYFDPSEFLSNDFSCAKSCAALVGDYQKPSFPSSVHIPPLNSHPSLLSSRHEGFKKIQDVGEDNSVSSLHLFFGNMDLPPSSYHDSLEELWDAEKEPEEVQTVMKVLPSVYHQYLDVFSNMKSEKLPPKHAYSDTLRAYISGKVEKCSILPSPSSTGAPVLFVKKKDGGLCLCVDYRKLNAVTRKNKYPVPPMNQLLHFLNSSSIFSKIDLRGAYNLLRIKEGDEDLTAFRAKYGSYEYLVMPFGLTNAPALFQNPVNDILQDPLDVYAVAYLDDIMASKCLFNVYSVEYLSYIVSSQRLKIEKGKLQQILNWPPLINLKALQSFLCFANFYHCFIMNYSKKISSLTSFLKKASCFPLNEEALETDASNYALGAVLSQASDSGKHPIAFNSFKCIPAELNYEIHDKELLGIVWALKKWKAFLLSLSSPFEGLTNHSSLQYFMSSKVLTFPQARWAQFLSEFHFSITQQPGCLATLLDSVSHWDNVYPERGEDFTSKNPMNFQQLIKKDEVQPSRYFEVKVESFSNLINSIQKPLWQDSQYRSILQELDKDTHSGKLSTKIQSVQQDVKRRLEAAINRLKRYEDKSRASPPAFNPGDMKVSTHAYHLKLPSQWKSIHPVFHISLLEPVKKSKIPNQNQEPPPPIFIEEEEEWEYSQILDSKLKRRK
ncbi:hypothetical protein O181_020510 [Austropuccinia psidii MF-1]|uniref:RNA-directed DNA polymerase n=1 Tax=Austropuccinia psidii MF-1 TaxID=1389203 RepID=A0A9Q3CDW8_9BASI|nr:hypothetical protein [Austropuccinia psidii MF-1]